MKVTYLGQSCFHIETTDCKFIIDPFISPNDLASHIDVDNIEVDYVLLTHGHQDHVVDAERILKNNNATLISNFEIVSYYQAKGLQGHPLNHGGKAKFDFGTVKFVNAIHSSVLPDGTYAGNPGGFVIETNEGTFYHAGDTALTMDMKLIPMTCSPLDFAILPVGDNFTMDYKDASIAAEFIECKDIIACHYDTFPYIEINHDEAKKYFDNKGNNLRFLKIGETIEK